MSNVLSFLRDHLCDVLGDLSRDKYNTVRAWHHKAADLIETQQREIDVISAAIGTTYYMDPPDGGNTPLSVQVACMAADSARYRWLRDKAGSFCGPEVFIDGEYWLGAELDARIDTARFIP